MDKDETQKAKDSLNLHYDWPCVYGFKFIMPTVPNREKELIAMFSVDVDVKTKTSKNAKYRSFTINAVMLSADEVLDKYAKASQIEGLISL
jgi:uncharacterized protein